MKLPTLSILTLVVFINFQSGVHSQEINNIHSLLASPSSTAIRICWGSDILGEDPAVEYSSSKAYEKTAKAGFVKSADGFNYQVEIRGLMPDTVYHYRCRFRNKFSNDCTFKTASKQNKDFTFAVVGDVQGKAKSQLWEQAAVWLARKKPAFWIPVGDLVQHGLVQNEWDCFFSDAKVLCESSPIMPVIGNHDCYNEQQKGHTPKLFYTQFPRPDNNSGKVVAWNYSFKYENAAFYILDNYPAAGEHQKNAQIVKEIETKWLDAELAVANSKWKFVFFHPPVYSSGGHGGDTLWLKDFW